MNKFLFINGENLVRRSGYFGGSHISTHDINNFYERNRENFIQLSHKMGPTFQNIFRIEGKAKQLYFATCSSQNKVCEISEGPHSLQYFGSFSPFKYGNDDRWNVENCGLKLINMRNKDHDQFISFCVKSVELNDMFDEQTKMTDVLQVGDVYYPIHMELSELKTSIIFTLRKYE